MLLSAVIAEDHDITREGIRAVLNQHTQARIVDAVSDGLAVVPAVEAHEPDVLVMDLSMPGLSGLDVLRTLRRRQPDTKVVVLSMHSDDSYILEALALGASAYVLKGESATELIEAVREVIRGRRYLSPSLSQQLLDAATGDGVVRDRYDTLTDREREVLQLSAEGLTSREVGERLFISHRTVEKHRQNIMAKLGLRNLAELVQYALERGVPRLAAE
jgi:DNA-binding NarL/FixJ family response regulator